MDFTTFDYFILCIIGFFSVLGVFRGLIGELISLFNWISASLLTIFFRPALSNAIYSKISSEMIANFLSSSIVFIVSIILISIITKRIESMITAKIPTSVNLTLGLFFGLIKGFLISSLIFLILLKIFGGSSSVEEGASPGWVENGELHGTLLFGSKAITPLTNSFFGKVEEEYIETLKKDNQEKEVQEDGGVGNSQENNGNLKDSLKRYISDEVDNVIDDQIDKRLNKKEDETGGYTDNQNDGLDRLIEIL